MKRTSWISGVAAACLLGGMAGPLMAQDQNDTSVPQSEYEQLKADMEALQSRLKAVEQRTEENLRTTAKLNEAAQADKDGVMFNTDHFTPGWVNVRNPNWMEATANSMR